MDFHPAWWQRLGRGGTRHTLSTRIARTTTQRHRQQIAPLFGQRIRRHSFFPHVLNVLLRVRHQPLKDLSPHFLFFCIARLDKDGGSSGVVNEFQTICSQIGIKDTGVGIKDIGFIGVDTLLFVLQAQYRVGKIHHKKSSFPVVARFFVQVTRRSFMDERC